MSDSTKKPEAKATKKKSSPKLNAIADLAGVPASADNTAASVDLTLPLSKLARHIGALLHNSPLFHMNGRIVVVDEDTGAIEDMDAVRFRSWIEDYAVVGTRRTEGFREASMSRETAQGILASRCFRKALRPLMAVQTVRLPVWADDERTGVELLPTDYHARTGVFTVDLLPYSTDMEADDARAFFLHYFEECAFAEDGELVTKRSFSAHMAALFTSYMLAMFPPDVPRPAFFYNGNQRTVGKSTTARSALSFVFGIVDGKGYKKNEEAFDKVIDSVAHECAPYFLLDNVEGKLYSSSLCRFISEPVYGYRIMGGLKNGKSENRRVVMITANGARATADLESRFLAVDLYLSEDALSRQFKHPITLHELESTGCRKKFLAAAWALVNHWNVCKCPRLIGATRTRFAEWERIMGGLLHCAQLGNPFTPSVMMMDDQGEAWRTFFMKLAGKLEAPGTKIMDVGDCLDLARDHELLDDMLPDAKDNNRAFGQYVRRKHSRGWMFTDEQRRRCDFKKTSDSNKGSRYTITVHPA